MIDRREFTFTGLAVLALGTGCGPAGPGSITVAATAAAGMNPGPDGADRPLTLSVLQLRSAAAFDGADFFALQDPAGALGGDLVKADQIALAAGATETRSLPLDPTTALVGIVAGYRDPAGKTFRVKAAVTANAANMFTVTVGPAGVTLASG